MSLPPTDEPIPHAGAHTCGMYVSLLGRIVATGAGGVLRIESGPDHRSLYFVNGSPVWIESNLPEDQLDAEQLADLDARMKLVKRGVAGPLQWRQGSWTWEPVDGLPAELLMNAVFLDSSPLAALWSGVQKTMRQDDVLMAVTDRAAGPLKATPGLKGFAQLEITGPLGSLVEHLGDTAIVEELLRQFAVEHQDLFKLLWFIEVLGWVERDGLRAAALGLLPAAPQGMTPEEALSPSSSVDLDPHETTMADEPSTSEFQVLSQDELALPPQQVLAAIRTGTVDNSPSALLAPRESDELEALSLEMDAPTESEVAPRDEWSGEHIRAAITPTVPTAEPSKVMPSLPRYRPTTDTGTRVGRYVQSSVHIPAVPDGAVSAPVTTPGSPAPDDGERHPRGRTNPMAERAEALSTTTGRRPPVGRSLVDLVRRDYRTRMGTDYYTFLGVPSKASAVLIDRASAKLMKRWTRAAKDPELPDDLRLLAKELVQVGHLARRMFSVAERRAEYDRRLARGQAPLAGNIKAARTRDLPRSTPGSLPPTPGGANAAHIAARQALRQGNYSHAVHMLRALRMQSPSDPDILCDLGWAVWKASAETDRDGAEEFLQLASTFDPRHERAREFLARVAVDSGDDEAARGRLDRYLKLRPDAEWARKALAELPEESQGNTGPRLAFWKK